ncbi:hypothetical protein [Flavobacterium sp. YO64]|uniref:hypothetical protein n=1 Tax=Flavobacterium sp. YO64 TaxID=394559 RepID=UPI00100C312F|nr:hypothetical protein [Flavobacterium sp. YO64]RXM46792.1 hypothetical protein BOW57_00505 [Flavobacterium sp. YO64]
MIIIKSKFKIFPIVLISYLSALPLLAVYLCFISLKENIILAVLFLLFVVVFWLTILKTRANSITMYEDGILVKRYFGLGKSKVYKYAELDGFATLFESGKGSLYESVFVLEEGKRVGCISSFYHSNFDALKLNLKSNLVDLVEMENNLKRANT